MVDRLWCEVSVRILWKSIWNYNTLFACLPNESKEILHKNKIFISTPTSKPPLFNYVTFIKTLSINEIIRKIKNIPNKNKLIVIQELLKMFMKGISLKELNIRYHPYHSLNLPFTTYPGAIDCLKNLSKLNCDSDNHSELFYQLSQICHHIQSLEINVQRVISGRLKDLISVQQKLKHLSLNMYFYSEDLKDIISSITKLSNNLIKLNLFGDEFTMPLSFIAKFTNLQEIGLKFFNNGDNSFEGFEKLQHVTFPQLHILKFIYGYPKHKDLSKFLESNGKNLEKLYFEDCCVKDSLNLVIAKFCSNLKSLCTTFLDNELETLKVILNHCQQLESIRVLYDYRLNHLNEGELLEGVAKYSPKSFHKLKISYGYGVHSELFSEKLEYFFINWMNRVPQKPLSLIIVDKEDSMKSLVVEKENMEVIEKYIKLGVIEEFETREFD